MRRRALRLGVSACLLGEKVRHDGGHKRDAKLLATLGRVAEWVPVCPEMAIGLGAPREPVDLVKTRRGVRMLGVCSGADHTDAMRRWARAHLEKLARLRLHGFVLKSRSPSCGVGDVKLRDAKGRLLRSDASGLFAAALIERFASLPVEDEKRLSDPKVRAAFLARVRAYARGEASNTHTPPHAGHAHGT
jgi:uncharacterized protein YbbK (DUF523 family)